MNMKVMFGVHILTEMYVPLINKNCEKHEMMCNFQIWEIQNCSLCIIKQYLLLYNVSGLFAKRKIRQTNIVHTITYAYFTLKERKNHSISKC